MSQIYIIKPKGNRFQRNNRHDIWEYIVGGIIVAMILYVQYHG
jgi:hypothetical protein